MPFLPAYRVRIYAPRREDATETTLLTPITGAPHADPCRMATVRGIAGYKPYLYLPKGKRAQLDLKARKREIGSLDFDVLDARTATDNTERWLTAFIGDPRGADRVLGCRVEVEENLAFDPVNPEAGWTRFWTGRVDRYPLSGRGRFSLGLRDMGEELKAEVFGGRPHSSIAYASMAALLPNGLPVKYGTMAATPPLVGIARSNAYSTALREIDVDQDENPQLRCIVTKAIEELAKSPDVELEHPTARVLLKWTEAGVVKEGEFHLARIARAYLGIPFGRYFNAAPNTKSATRGGILMAKRRVTRLAVKSISGGLALPAAGTKVEARVLPATKPTDAAPLVIGDVHVVQLMADMLDGKFGPIAAGQPVRTFPRDTTRFSALIADPTLPRVRMMAPKPEKMADALARLCLQAGLAFDLDAEGRVTLIDLRLPSTADTLPRITRTDLALPSPPEWSPDLADLVTRVEFDYVYEEVVAEEEIGDSPDKIPDVPATMVRETRMRFIPADIRREADLGEARKLSVDASALRAQAGETHAGIPRLDWVQHHLDALEDEIRGPYARGPVTMGAEFRRTAVAAGTYPGALRILELDETPNHASNRRGGERLVRCIDRAEEGVNVRLSFLDLGANTVAASPALGILAAGTADPEAALQAPVTLNAEGDPAEVHVAIASTATTVRPADDSALWYRAARLTAGGTAQLPTPAPSQRAWVRGRSLPRAGRDGGAGTLRLPSPWVFPPAPGYLDLATVPVVRRASATASDAGAVEVRWEGVENAAGVRIHYTVRDALTATVRLQGSVDADAALGVRAGVVTAWRGEEVLVEVEPWTGWTGSAVSGTAGPRARTSHTLPPASSSPTPRAIPIRTGLTIETATWEISGVLGAGGADPVSLRAETPDGWMVADWTASPLVVNMAREGDEDVVYRVRVRDAAGREGVAVNILAPATMPLLGPEGRLRPEEPMEGGDDYPEGRRGGALRGGGGDRGGREGDERSGFGGVPGALVHTIPILDGDGLQELISPRDRRVRGVLGAPNGTGFTEVEDGGNRGRTGLSTTGYVNLGVPRGHAVFELPGISGVDGRLDTTVAISSGTSFPIDTADNVGSLANGATVEDGSSRGRLGFTVGGYVNLGVPRTHAVFELPGISSVDGRLDTTVAISGGTSFPIDTADNVGSLANGATVEDGSSRGRLGFTTTGVVNLGVPRTHARAELPGISGVDGRLDTTVAISGGTSFPIDTADNVGALANGATVEDGSGRARSGLGTDGKVGLGVPRGHAVFELPGISGVDGRLDTTVAISGGTSFPIDTADNVSAMANGATVEDGSARGRTGLTGMGVVNLGVPRGHARAELPGISGVDGRLDTTVAISGGTSFPIDTADNVGSLANGATVEDGSARGRAGLSTAGVVGLGVPRGHAVANVPAISSSDGRVLDTVEVSGKVGVYPVGTDDSVGALSNGATVEDGATRARAGIADTTGRLAAIAGGIKMIRAETDLSLASGTAVVSAANAEGGLVITRGAGAASGLSWFGPYWAGSFVGAGDFLVIYRMRVANRSSAARIITVDVARDTGAGVSVIASKAVRPSEFAAASVWQDVVLRVRVDYDYARLEFRGVDFVTGITDLELDYIKLVPLTAHADGVVDGVSRRVTSLNEAAGGGRGFAGLATDGKVGLGVPRIHAVSEIPAIAGADGRLDTTVAISGGASFPLDTADNVGALANGATVEQGAGRANAAINSSNLLTTGLTSTADLAGVTAGTVKARVGLAGQVWIQDPGALLSLSSYDADTAGAGGVRIEWSGPAGGQFRFKNGGSVLTFNAGGITGVSPDTKHWVYYDAGLNVIDVTTNKMTALGDDRMILGDIITALDGSSGSTGGGGTEII